MQILYAAPFVITAGLLFILLSSVPRLRRWAITAATATIAFGPGSLIAYAIFALVMYKVFNQSGPVNWIYAVLYGLGGLVAAVVAAKLVRSIEAFISTPGRYFIVGSGAFCSYFVVLFAIRIALSSLHLGLHSDAAGWWMFTLITCLSGVAAWFLCKHVQDFFPDPKSFSKTERRTADSPP